MKKIIYSIIGLIVIINFTMAISPKNYLPRTKELKRQITVLESKAAAIRNDSKKAKTFLARKCIPVPNFTFSESALLWESFTGITFPPTGWDTIQHNNGYQYNYPCFWARFDTITLVHTMPGSAGLWWSYYHQDEWLITPPITLTGSPNNTYYLKWWYFGYRGSTYSDHYYTKISTDGGTNWTVLYDLSEFSPPDTGWNYYETPVEIDLSTYAGQTINIAWHADDPPTNDGMWYAWLIDDIEIWHPDEHDVSATSILAPSGAVPQGSVITPKVIVHNFGLNSDTFPVTMEIGTIYTQTIPDVDLDPDETDTIEFPDWTATPGAFTTKAYTALVGDMNLLNDTAYGSVMVVQYVEDFEANDGNYIPDPLTGGWEWGVPNSGPYGAHSGVNVWGTVLNGQYPDSANFKLNSCEFAATADNPELRFWHWYDMEDFYDGGNVKISTNGGVSWTIVYPQGGYPTPAAAASNAGIPGEPCYSAYSNGWEEAIFTLPVDSGQIFQLRWHFGSDGSVTYDGWYIDDVSGAGFNIVTIDHDVGATRILEPSGSVPQGSIVTPKVTIRNFGINNEIFPVVMKIGTVYCETLPSVLLNAGQIDTVEFPDWTASVGLFTTTAFTDLNGDMRRSNDTTHSSVTVLEFVQNFESNNGGYLPDPSSGAWEWGIPTSGPGNAHSGVNLWATVLGGEYADYANWKLTSTAFQATQNNPELRFWHWYDMETEYDGGNVKLSTDGGSTWTIVTPQGGYPYIADPTNIGIPNEPCYSGHPMIWQEAIFTLPVNNGQIFKLRWHFGSDGSVTYYGWYVDDVAGVGFHVGIAEAPSNHSVTRSFLTALPDPISYAGAKISFGVKQSGNVSLSIFDASGRLVKTLARGKFETGKYSIVWNANDDAGKNVSNGVYLVVYRDSDTKLTKKLIVNK